MAMAWLPVMMMLFWLAFWFVWFAVRLVIMIVMVILSFASGSRQIVVHLGLVVRKKELVLRATILTSLVLEDSRRT